MCQLSCDWLSFYLFICIARGNGKVMLPWRYFMQEVWPWSQTCSNSFIVPWASVCYFIWLGTRGFHCIRFRDRDSFSACQKASNIEQLSAFYGKRTVDISPVHQWVRKSRDSGKNLDLKDQSCSGRPFSANHDLNKQQSNKLVQENCWISQRAIVGKLNTGLARVSEIIAG
jgi:hypothetical protein